MTGWLSMPPTRSSAAFALKLPKSSAVSTNLLTPNMECGDNVIIINAEKVILTGKKMTDHEYLTFTGYPGGQRATTPEVLMKKALNKHLKPGYNPLFIKVMKGMLPKNRLGRRLIENMHVYVGPNHPHQAQEPKVIDINKLK